MARPKHSASWARCTRSAAIWPAPREHHQQALDLARAISSRRDEARALAGLARCAAAAGSTTQAKMMLRQAHHILQQVGGAEIRDILAEVDALIRQASA